MRETELVLLIDGRVPMTVAEIVRAHPEIGPVLDVIEVKIESMAERVREAMECDLLMSRCTDEVLRDLNHPMNRAKQAPRSPKARFRKGR